MELDTGKRAEPRRAQSVHRALRLLETIASKAQETGIVEISTDAQLPVSTVHRLLSTLTETGFVVQNPETGRYRIGARSFEIGHAFLKQTQLLDVVRPKMVHLSKVIGETVNLAVEDNESAVYVDQKESDHPLKIFTTRGTRVPLYCTGVGKVFLAAYPEHELENYLRATNLEPLTPNTLINPSVLRQHLEQVREQGYAIDDEDFQVGVRCVAAPILNHNSETVAALSVSAPLHRISDEHLRLMIPQLTNSTAVISRELGLEATRNA